MHEEQWDGTEYSLYSNRLNPRGPEALPPPTPKDEFGLGRALSQEVKMAEEYTGLFGFVFKSFKNAIFPDRNKGKEVFYQGSRQMDSTSRRYYEKELGAGYAPSPGMEEMFGYTEPIRRFIQREGFEPQANEIPNTWSPPPPPPPSVLPHTKYSAHARRQPLAHFSALRCIFGLASQDPGGAVPLH